MALSLADGLTGFLALSEVSEQMFQRVSDYVSNTRDGDAEEDEEHTIPRPSDIFHLGQLIRCAVVSVTDVSRNTAATNNSTHARIELTMRLNLINRNLSFDVLQKGLNLCGAIKSIEDKGFIVDFGSSADFSGFLSFQDCCDYCSERCDSKSGVVNGCTRLQVGFPVECIVKGLNASTRTVALAHNCKEAKLKGLPYCGLSVCSLSHFLSHNQFSFLSLYPW